MEEYEMAEEWNQIQSNFVMRRNWNKFLYAKIYTQRKKKETSFRKKKKRNKLSQKVRSIVVSLRLDHFTKVMTM